MPDQPVLSKEWVIPSRLGEEKKVIQAISFILQKSRLPDDKKEDILSAVAEGVINAVEHGNRLREEASVLVLWQEYPDRYIVRVYDQGEGYSMSDDDLTVKEKGAEEIPRGWGLFLMAALSDALKVGRDRTGFYTEIRFDITS